LYWQRNFHVEVLRRLADPAALQNESAFRAGRSYAIQVLNELRDAAAVVKFVLLMGSTRSSASLMGESFVQKR
jgi:hypothetical protein